MMMVILILTAWVGVLLGSIQGCTTTTTKEEYKHHQEEGRGFDHDHLSISEAKKSALEEAILGQQQEQHGTDDDNTTNTANNISSSNLPYTITVHDNGRPLVGSQDVNHSRTCESRSGPTYAVLTRKMMDEGWYIEYMIVHDYIVTGSLATRLPHLALTSSFTNILSKSDSLGCSQLRVLLGVTSDDDDEEEGAAYYVVPWLGITDEQIPIAHAIEYYNVLKLLPTHHHKDAAYALLRKGGIPEARAAEAPLLTKLIIPITKHEDGHDGGGGGGLMQQDDKKSDGDHCRFGIRGTGLEFTTITHTAGTGTGSPGGGNYLSGVYCGQEPLHDDNDARRFLMDFFNT
ncbi:hypothetical protein FOL46_000850 [Perkinsus olseni]|uniref:Uncharacterized protein n=1 Tax=Perkinsus olseni TaxID=32597 RepID=A0A7J6KVL5_PEROL|nr:hypothetical protein FOL46_000850 [Perkinsus olseni]